MTEHKEVDIKAVEKIVQLYTIERNESGSIDVSLLESNKGSVKLPTGKESKDSNRSDKLVILNAYEREEKKHVKNLSGGE